MAGRCSFPVFPSPPTAPRSMRRSARLSRALREYAADWQERLAEATNHRDNWALVQLITLSEDDQLPDWLVSWAR